MRVILLQDVLKLGHKFEVKNVADGYARNFLIPRKLVEPATGSALANLEKRKAQNAVRAEEVLKETKVLAEKINNLKVEIKEKTAEDGTLFGSINAQKIADKLKELGYNINKTQIKLERPIKERGEYNIRISLGHEIDSEIKIIVG